MTLQAWFQRLGLLKKGILLKAACRSGIEDLESEVLRAQGYKGVGLEDHGDPKP